MPPPQIRLALNLIRLYAVLSAPFIPDAAANMMSSMNTLDIVDGPTTSKQP